MKTFIKRKHETYMSQNMSEVLCYHTVWSVSLPQDPAEGISKVTAVLLGSGGTLGGSALGERSTLGEYSWRTTGILSFFFPCFLAVRRWEVFLL